MKILHTIAGVWADTGGPATSVPSLCAALAARGLAVTLLTGAGDLAPAVLDLATSVRLVTRPLGHYLIGNFSRSFAAECRELARECDLLHSHGLWLHPNLVTSATGRAQSKPVVISPRGMLAPWALKRSAFRKRLVWYLAQRRCLAAASCIHVTSRDELADVRRVGLVTPVATIPNGVPMEEYPWQTIESSRQQGREQRLLFLSRIHPKKGVDTLLAAWRIVSQRHPAAQLLIAGPGQLRYVRELRASLGEAELQQAKYIGSISGIAKLEMLARVRAVVLPSHNENYGMVVAEALACGTPVIVSTGVPWESVESERTGWRVDAEIEALAQAMDEALLASEDRIDEMGFRGRRLIERDHSVEVAAGMMTRVYEWACGRASMPEFVDVAG